MIAEADLALAKRCIEAYYATCDQLLPTPPLEMRCDPKDPNEWVQWKLIESKLTESDVSEFEKELPFKLPPLFRAFLRAYCVLSMDFGEYLLPVISSDAPMEKVRLSLLHPDLWKIGYAPFAGNVYGDPLCFDLLAPMPDGDFAIVVINHDMVKPDGWNARESVVPHATKVGDSFRQFFTSLCLDRKQNT